MVWGCASGQKKLFRSSHQLPLPSRKVPDFLMHCPNWYQKQIVLLFSAHSKNCLMFVDATGQCRRVCKELWNHISWVLFVYHSVLMEGSFFLCDCQFGLSIPVYSEEWRNCNFFVQYCLEICPWILLSKACRSICETCLLKRRGRVIRGEKHDRALWSSSFFFLKTLVNIIFTCSWVPCKTRVICLFFLNVLLSCCYGRRRSVSCFNGYFLCLCISCLFSLSQIVPFLY